MNIIVVGAGASGVVNAIYQKRNHPKDDILIIEHLDKPLKKILATGNGKCNLGNSNMDFALFNNEKLAKDTIIDYNYKDFFDSISIKTKLIGDLAYPVSESSVSIREALLKDLDTLGINVNLNEKLMDYNVKEKIEVITNKKTYIVDKLVLAGGLKSSPKLGSDGSVIEILSRHNYQIDKLNPGLSPIYTKENTHMLDGVRCKAKVSVEIEKKIIHEETGELLFKDRGLSGIVIFNSMSYIARQKQQNAKFYIDLLPDYSEDELNAFLNSNGLDKLLLAYLNPKISAYLEKRFTTKTIIKGIKNLEFNFDESYGFDYSQVTVGGIKTNQLNENFESKLEKNVYIIGELVNVDGPCGGYNLTWAFASAKKAALWKWHLMK